MRSEVSEARAPAYLGTHFSAVSPTIRASWPIVTPLDTSDPPQEPNALTILSDAELATLTNGLFCMARHRLGDIDLAKDGVQQTLRVLSATPASRFRDSAHVGAYAQGIAKHKIIDAKKRRDRAARLEVDAENFSIASGDPDALEVAIAEETAAAVRAVLTELSDDDRELVRLSYSEGLSLMEIAERLGVSPEAARQRKSRALSRLRDVCSQNPALSRSDIETDKVT